MTQDLSLEYALKSLDGLSTGDAFGELFFGRSPYELSFEDLPVGPWKWTDDTHMALSIVQCLRTHKHIEQDSLAGMFSKRYIKNPNRGYGGGTHKLLHEIASGTSWRLAAPKLFGTGSYGNGGAMRAAPIGGYFYFDIDRAAKEAKLSAEITHAHLEGQAGAIAVAVAAAVAANKPYPQGDDFLKEVTAYIPESETKSKTILAMQIPSDAIIDAMKELGTGGNVSAQDTVPFCLWSAAHHLSNYESALWNTAKGLGDVDTTCAIVGGIVALSAPEIPKAYLDNREPITI